MLRQNRRIKKRSFFVAGICVLVMLIPLFFLFQYSKQEVESNHIADFTVQNTAMGKSIHGLGMNVLDVKNGNIILNNSFEPIIYRQNFVVDGGNQQIIKVAMPNDPQSGIFPDDFFINAKVNVITSDENGQRTLKKTGVISRYDKDKIDQFYTLSLPNDLPENIKWTDLADDNNHILIGGVDGYLLSINSFTDIQLHRLESKKDIVSISKYQDSFLIMDESGNIYKMSNEKLELWFNANALIADELYLFNNISTEEIQEENKLRWNDLSTNQNDDLEWSFMAVGEKGNYLFATQNSVLRSRVNTEETINSIASNEDGYYLVGNNATGFYTQNGEKFRYLDISANTNWNSIIARGKQILVMGDNANVLSSEDGFIFDSLYDESIRNLSLSYSQKNHSEEELVVFNPNFVNGAILSGEQIVLLDDKGNIYQTENSGNSWENAENSMNFPNDENQPTHQFEFVQRISSGHILAANNNGEISYATMGLEIELDSPLENSQYQRGDLLELEQTSALPLRTSYQASEMLAGDWFLSNKEVVRIQSDELAPGGGLASLEVDLSQHNKKTDELISLYQNSTKPNTANETTFVLQQIISNEYYQIINENTFFQYEFWAKADAAATIDINIENLNVAIEPNHKEIGTEWQKYQGVLVLPNNSLTSGNNAVFNINIQGTAKVYLDQIWFGAVEDRTTFIDENIAESLKGSIMRMPYIPIGKSGYATDSWLLTSESISSFVMNEAKPEIHQQFNLAKHLELTKSLKMNPWLTIDSQTSDMELRHLMQYLFGLENTTYGNLRIEQGGTARYSDMFDQIYLEINDSNQLLSSDKQKKLYVDWVIKTISDTPEYQQVKNNLIFVDGMIYKENVMESIADYHASDLNINSAFKNTEELEQFNNTVYEMIPRNIERTFDSRSELIRSTKITAGNIRVADILATSLSLLGEEKDLTLMDVDFSSGNRSYELYESFGQLGFELRGFQPYDVTSSIEQNQVVASAFGRDYKRVVILMNLSDDVASCQISNLALENYTQYMYDADGNLLEEELINRENKVFSLLPGGVLIVSGEENGQ